jgi:hypothetical protein
MSTRTPRHYHRWISAPELGSRHYACVCGAQGWRNHAGKIVTGHHAHPDRDLDDSNVDYTGGRCPTLDDYDAGRVW